MRQRIRSSWFGLQSTLWFVPSVMTTLATLLAFLLLEVDQRVVDRSEISSWWLFEGGVEGARGVLSTIAGTMMTVATTAFSITIVALQLGSSQFSPRILKGFTSDRGNQLVLGTFIATFAYTVVVLRSVRSDVGDQAAFVPSIAITVAIIFAFAAIGSLIYFFHHATRTIQASVVIERAVQDTFSLIDARLERERTGDGQIVAEIPGRDDGIAILAAQSGYITGIDSQALRQVASDHALVLTVTSEVGDHLLSNSPLATVPRHRVRDLSEEARVDLEAGVRRAVAIEMERTLEHDILLGFRQISDIAIKALSPGINDPTTATIAIDRLGEALLRVLGCTGGTRFLPTAGGDGGVWESVVGFDRMLDQCLPQIRHYGADDVIVMTHLLHVLERVANGAPPAAYEALELEARLTAAGAQAALALEADRERVREAAAWAFAAAR